MLGGMKCLVAALRIAWVAALLTGCGGGSDGPASGQHPPIDELPPPLLAASCNGANLAALNTLVYVRSDGADLGRCGTTTANACASIQQGIASCAGSGCGVVVRHGLYNLAAPIVLRDGVSVFGGCLFDGETGRSYRSIVNGPADQPAVSAAAIVSPTTFQGFVVRAADSAKVGGSSIAMTVTDSGALALNQVRLVAGNGMAGSNGDDAGAVGGGASGSGVTGGQTCPAAGSPFRGGAGGTNSLTVANCVFDCDCTETPTYATGGTGPGGGPNPGGPGVSAGRAGVACAGRGIGRDADNPGDGGGGGPGDAGVCTQQAGAANGSVAGTLAASAQWSGSSGGNGSLGGVGAAGGGGQAGGNATWINEGGNPYNGASGGGGGGGGCGGLPGDGGRQGGASIALAIAGTIGQVDARSVMVAARGGDGGPGGRGGVGGAGGGGTPSGGGRYATIGGYGTSVPGNGGAGGVGGAGGAGSGGAGGNGGPSIGIAALSNLAVSVDAVYLGTPGNGAAGGGGGVGGFGNCTAATGLAGLTGSAAPLFDYTSYSPVLGSGQRLANNQALSGSTSRLLMQTDGNLCIYAEPGGGNLWCSNRPQGGTQTELVMQTDGNLCVVVPQAQAPIWCNGTAGNPGAYLTVLPDGHAAVMRGSTQLWRAP